MLPLKPKRGGFLRPFGCGLFVRDYLFGRGPNSSPVIDTVVGAPQADLFHYYKMAIIKATALDRATKQEEKQAKKEKRRIEPANIEALAQWFQDRMPYKGQNCRYHSFGVYFSNIIRLGWVEKTGKEEPSAFQDHYPQGPPRKYYRLTEAGKTASDAAWSNPQAALYGRRKKPNLFRPTSPL